MRNITELAVKLQVHQDWCRATISLWSFLSHSLFLNFLKDRVLASPLPRTPTLKLGSQSPTSKAAYDLCELIPSKLLYRILLHKDMNITIILFLILVAQWRITVRSFRIIKVLFFIYYKTWYLRYDAILDHFFLTNFSLTELGMLRSTSNTFWTSISMTLSLLRL